MGGFTKDPKKYKPCFDCGIGILKEQRHEYNGVYPLCYICFRTRDEIKDGQVIPLYSQMPKIWRNRRDMLEGKFTDGWKDKLIDKIHEQIVGFRITKKSKLVKSITSPEPIGRKK